jgi:uncharacterized protein (TIGR03000 family)
VTVPEGAQIRVDNTPTTSTGAVRQFDSPPLTPGRHYTYSVHARGDDNGHKVDQSQSVEFAAGDRVYVRFPVAPGTTAKAPAVTHG